MKITSILTGKYSIRCTVGGLFIFATLFTALCAITTQYYFSRQMSEEHVLSKLTTATAKVSEYIQQVEADATSSAKILRSVSMATDYRANEQEARAILVQVLKDNPLFYSLYFGSKNDDFYQIINLESSPVVRQKIKASAHERWAIIIITGEKSNRVRRINFYNEAFDLTNSIAEPSNYYPTQRPWFHAASSEYVYKTEPYLFQHLKITGQTYAIKSHDMVLGIDIVLSAVSSKMTALEMGIDTNSTLESFIFSQHGELIATNLSAHQATDAIPPSSTIELTDKQREIVKNTRSLRVSNQTDWGPYDFTMAGKPRGYSVDLLKMISQKTGLNFAFVNGFNAESLNYKYRRGSLDILYPVMSDVDITGDHSLPLFEAELAMATLVDTALPILDSQFINQTVGIVGGRGMQSILSTVYPTAKFIEFSSYDSMKSALKSRQVSVIVDTYFTLNEMKATMESGSVSVSVLENIEPVPFYLYMKHQNADVLAVIDKALNSFTEEEITTLNEKWLTLVAQKGNFVPYSQLVALSRDKTLHNTMVRTTIAGKDRFLFVTPLASKGAQTEYFAVVIPEQIVTQQVIGRLLQSLGWTIIIMLVLLPVAWVFGSPIVRPIIQLREETQKIKARKFDQVTVVDTFIKEVSDLSYSMLDMAIEIKQHEKAQEEFVESFIQLIAQAIDDKSPYTAGHCNRVPELGLMLAKVAESSQDGEFKNFCFANDDERREFRIAAWLHDCGKITTPEHIVDKGTKLEANYNRIHEIRTRFEVLWRDAEIDYLNALIVKECPQEEGLARLAMRKQQLKEDFAFIAKSNIGGEFMEDAQVERIKQIAEQTWIRHFDDRLGLSPLEEFKTPRTEPALPATEYLLVDRAEHIVYRDRPMIFDEQYGINMDVPNYLYNLGEVYNLSIRRGTLTAEDRFKINEHMISGIKMLEALPFPAELSRVPRYASTHHETLKGTGYPRKLSADDLSIPERILVIADIFEALTAADRPYKKAKPLSVAVDIMYKMALDKHVDMALFILFLQSGTYLEYARRFLPEQQIDYVDISQYMTEPVAA
ncbi:HD domain-containing phosphohydrolase [Photobacterium nomapromontoriensis]|uniref:HD domain-containing phosphohydrolase n=1 Tax=Photobacterium nomapromontoriensis TaxID=2910237 RepID=UPI003D0AF5F9